METDKWFTFAAAVTDSGVSRARVGQLVGPVFFMARTAIIRTVANQRLSTRWLPRRTHIACWLAFDCHETEKLPIRHLKNVIQHHIGQH
jgi:hypothetical protein